MPLTYTIDRSQRVVISRFSGVLSESDIHSARERLHSDASFNPAFSQLVDLSEVTAIDISVPSLARIAGTTSYTPGTRRAIVGVNDIQYEMARLYAAFSEPHQQLVHVFRDRAIAEEWLSGRQLD